MKLFTKEIDKQLFAQYAKGSDLENQKVIAKIFNPYGRGVWYIINSDPNDPDYLWAIVDLFDVEVGSVSRSELETLKVPPFRLGLERDMSFTPINAAELFKGASQGKRYAEGGELDIAAQNKDMLLNYAEEFEHHTKEFEKAAKNAENVMPWVIAKTERASTDLADVTHYLESENEKRREKIEGEEDDIDDFDRGGEVREFNVLYFKTITNRSGSKMDVMRDRDIISGSLEKVLSKAYDGLTPIDSYANITDRKNSSVVARIMPNGKGEVLEDGYGLNVGEIEIEQEVEEVEEKPKKKLFGLFAKDGIVITKIEDGKLRVRFDEPKKEVYAEGGEIEDLSDLKGRHFYIYSLGVSVPHVSIIENARITDKKYRHRDVVIESVGGTEERFPLEKLDSFLNGEQIEINDGSEIYVIQLLKDKMAEGGIVLDPNYILKIFKEETKYDYQKPAQPLYSLPARKEVRYAFKVDTPSGRSIWFRTKYFGDWKDNIQVAYYKGDNFITIFQGDDEVKTNDLGLLSKRLKELHSKKVDKYKNYLSNEYSTDSSLANERIMAEGGEIPNKKGQIVKMVNPYPDEDPNQLYEVVEQYIDEYSNPEDKILISALNTEMEIPPTFRVEKKELVVVSDKMAEGGKLDKYNVSFNYNPSNLSNKDAENIVSQYTKNWKHDNDFDDVTFYVMGLSKEDTDMLVKELKMEDVYNIEVDKSNYAKGGMMSNGGSTSSPNAKFMKWFGDWLKSVNKYIYVSISIPNEFSSPIKDGNDEIVILDIIEKKGDADVKKYMNEIVKKADEFGVSIYLQPIPRTHNLKSQEHKDKITKDYLIKYYEKFGFKNMDSGFMVREPKMAEGGGIDEKVNYLIEVNNEKISSRKKGSANYFDRGSGKEVVTYSLIEFKGDVKNPESKKRLLGITNHKLRLLKDKGGKLGVGAVGALNFFKKYGYDLNVEPKLLKADEKLDVKKVGENVYVEKMISTSLLSEFYDIYEPAYIDPEVKERYEKSKESNKMASGGMMAKGGKIYKIQVKDKYDIQPKWKDDTWHTGGKKYLSFKDAQVAVKKLQGDTAYAHQEFKVVEDKEKMAKGGVVEKKYFMTISFDQKQRSGGYGINRVSVSVRAKNQTEAISKAKKLIREGYRGDMPIKNVEVIYPSIKVEDITYEKGGKITFDDKVSAIKKSLLERKKVSPSVQKDYGKTYSPKEAEESAKRIVGAMTAKERLMKKRKK